MSPLLSTVNISCTAANSKCRKRWQRTLRMEHQAFVEWHSIAHHFPSVDTRRAVLEDSGGRIRPLAVSRAQHGSACLRSGITNQERVNKSYCRPRHAKLFTQGKFPHKWKAGELVFHFIKLCRDGKHTSDYWVYFFILYYIIQPSIHPSISPFSAAA